MIDAVRGFAERGGPIYAEPAPSLGRHALLVGVLFNQLPFRNLRGVPLTV